MNDRTYSIRILKGKPYQENTEINLLPGNLLIGRTWGNYKPDISFTSAHISKKHALITCTNTGIYITDLSGKNGTQVNGQVIDRHEPFALHTGDVIDLAQGSVFFSLQNSNTSNAELQDEDTGDLNTPADSKQNSSSLIIDPNRREIVLDGQHLCTYGKDIELLFFLYENRDKAVSYCEIKRRIWYDRSLNQENLIPDVGNDEVIALVYRLRKRLRTCGSCIVSIPRYGYRLDV